MDVISKRYAAGLRTYLITLKFADLARVADCLGPISYGGDCWEFRADLIGPPSTVVPALDDVRKQLCILQALPRRLPILFTVRTVSQGGRFPDGAGREALALMTLAAELGCEYIDVEMSWPADVVEGILAVKGDAKIVASNHVFDGSVKWTSQAVDDMCAAADAVGDIVKLCIQAETIYDSLELALFVRRYQARGPKPIIAVAMGPDGQLSRFTAPVTFVTHPLIPAPPGSDQLCLADIHRARHLLGQLPSRRFGFAGPRAVYETQLFPRFQAAFAALGFPYSTCHVDGKADAGALVARPDFGGVYVPDVDSSPFGTLVLKKTPAAETIGSADTVSVATENGQAVLSADNTAWRAILACLHGSGSLLSSSSSTAIVLGGMGETGNRNAAWYALQQFGIGDAVLVGNDAEAAAAQARARFPLLSIRTAVHLEEAVASRPPGALVVICPGRAAGGAEDGDGLLAHYSGVLLDAGGAVGSTAAALKQTWLGPTTGEWKVFSASDVLQKQADILFGLWTGRDAPEYTEPRPNI